MTDEEFNEKWPKWLEARQPLRVVVRVGDNETLQGLVEHSFSMDWDATRVNIFWSGKAYSMLGEHLLDAVKDGEHNAELFSKDNAVSYDPMSDDCPIQVDWRKWMEVVNNQRGSKFDKRNAYFKRRVPVEDTKVASSIAQDDALEMFVNAQPPKADTSPVLQLIALEAKDPKTITGQS